ncbi:MAG: hypothetical protein E7284_00335 [Lachnospiraceae bacterium]|nr:hypothetical protein [Lachnospiraceae bacterium]
MSVYSRKVSFIDYYINGVKSGNIGVVRQKVTKESVFFTVEIFGLEKWRNNRVEISVGSNSNRKKLFELKIKEGRGKKEYVIELEEFRGDEYKKIIFELENGCFGIADLCDLPDIEMQEKKKIEEVSLQKEAENALAEGHKEEYREDEKLQNDEKLAQQEMPDNAQKIYEISDGSSEEMNELLSECMEPQPDKWEVIKKKYPILYPFKGQGPYVSIKPVDLQLLNNKYHHLSSNSYLMHGFYQYRHMILGEYSQEKGTFFYVGVPGEFVKKEQSSAAMFGFEGYEHSGDLGYYLYRVEL